MYVCDKYKYNALNVIMLCQFWLIAMLSSGSHYLDSGENFGELFVKVWVGLKLFGEFGHEISLWNSVEYTMFDQI